MPQPGIKQKYEEREYEVELLLLGEQDGTKAVH